MFEEDETNLVFDRVSGKAFGSRQPCLNQVC